MHKVFFHEEESAVVQRVKSFLRGGLEGGGHAVVIAMPEHAKALQRVLPTERVHWMDADEALSRFLVDDWPDEEAFQRTVGNLMRAASQRGPTFVYGEMVAVLCLRGHHEAAVRLEQLWNSLLNEVGVNLLCGYPRRVFARSQDATHFETILHEHETQEPFADPVPPTPASTLRLLQRT